MPLNLQNILKSSFEMIYLYANAILKAFQPKSKLAQSTTFQFNFSNLHRNLPNAAHCKCIPEQTLSHRPYQPDSYRFGRQNMLTISVRAIHFLRSCCARCNTGAGRIHEPVVYYFISLSTRHHPEPTHGAIAMHCRTKCTTPNPLSHTLLHNK